MFSIILFKEGFVGELLTAHFPAAQMPSQKAARFIQLFPSFSGAGGEFAFLSVGPLINLTIYPISGQHYRSTEFLLCIVQPAVQLYLSSDAEGGFVNK